MDIRSLTGGAAFALLLSVSASHAIDLPGVFGSRGSGSSSPPQMAQAVDPRVNQLEEQIRTLNGTVEELNFQLLQMQEQIRKMQEDNEFRFQELEKNRKSDAGAARPSVAQAAKPAAPSPATTSAITPPASVGPVGNQAGPAGAPPRDMGTITFDAAGNVTGGSVGDQRTIGPDPKAVAGVGVSAAAAGQQVAALPATNDPEELYRNSYEHVLSGDYGAAEAGFRDHIKRFPADTRTADARFWLGESLLGQRKFRDAAEVFLNANRDYPSSKKAPDMMLKLGISLAGLNQRDVACATFSEIGRRYPGVSGALKDRVKQEQALASC